MTKLKTAGIYKSEKQFIIHSYSYTTDGVLLATIPFFNISIPFIENDIVEKLKQSLNSSTVNVPHPTNWEAQSSQFSNAVGYTLKDLHKKFQYCSVEDHDNLIRIFPTENKGYKGGWLGLKDKRIDVSKSTNVHDFYELILKAFSMCES